MKLKDVVQVVVYRGYDGLFRGVAYVQLDGIKGRVSIFAPDRETRKGAVKTIRKIAEQLGIKERVE